MNKNGFAIFGLATLLFWSTAVFATDNCSLSSCDIGNSCASSCFAKNSNWSFGGWMQAGFFANAHGNKFDHSSDNIGNGNGALLSPRQNTYLNLDQLVIYGGKELDTSCGWDWGFTAQLNFGAHSGRIYNDASFDHNWGTGDYSLSMPNLYAEVGYRDLSFKFGHFTTILGYEAYNAPDSFFYSHSYSYGTTPFSHVGALATYKLSEQIKIMGGWVGGWDNFSNREKDSMFLGGIEFTPCDKFSVGYYTSFGRMNHNDEYSYWTAYDNMDNGGSMDKYFNTLIFTWNISQKWLYIMEYTLNVDNFNGQHESLWGINNHLIYTINDNWATGFRFEYMKNNGTYQINGIDNNRFYEVTWATNWKVCKTDLTIRPEIRYDWVTGGENPFNNGENSTQLSGGLSATYVF